MPPRPRIVVLITLAAAGGAQTYVMLLVPALVERFDVTVAAWGPGPLRGAVEAVGADYVELRHVRRPLSLWRDLLGLLELVRLLRRVRPQIVHANSSKAGVLGRVAAVVARVPIRIFTVHGWAFAAYSGSVSRVYLWADRLMRPLTTRIICVAENERRLGLAAGTCTDARTVVIRNAVDVAAARQAALEGDPPVLVTVGRFSYPKDFVTLVQALARLPAGSFRARVLGDGPDRPPIEAEIARHGLAGAVELTGEVDDVAEQLAEADVFVLSSRSEGLPISVLEAMAAGLPVVASAVGGLPELVEEDETGTLVPAGDADALAAALQRLIEDPERRRRLGRAGRARAEARFDLPRFRDAHLDLYASLLGEGDPAAEPSATVRP